MQLQGVRMRGRWYCGTKCLEQALCEILARGVVSRPGPLPSHRIPLGLLLLSRQQLTAEQLRIALELQRTGGHGKIGEWLQQLGFASENQITAALARQWACPVFRTGAGNLNASHRAHIPMLLLESFQMIPVELAEPSTTLLVAFSENIDHTVLYVIEQMLGYHTEACFVCPSALQKALRALAQRQGRSDAVFDRMEDPAECARIIGSYAAHVEAEEVRLATCGQHIWIRLERLRRETVNLVLRAPRDNPDSLPDHPPLPAAFAR